MKELIAGGCDVYLAAKNGWTPAHAAAHEGRTDAVKELILAGCDINLATKGGMPLQVAERYGHTCIATLIHNEPKRREEEKARAAAAAEAAAAATEAEAKRKEAATEAEAKRKEEEKLKIFLEGSVRVKTAAALVASAKEIAIAAVQRYSAGVKEAKDAKTAADEAEASLGAALAKEADAIEEERRIYKAQAQRAAHSAAGTRALEEAKAELAAGRLGATRSALVNAKREFAAAGEDRASDVEAVEAELKREEALEHLLAAYDPTKGLLSKE